VPGEQLYRARRADIGFAGEDENQVGMLGPIKHQKAAGGGKKSETRPEHQEHSKFETSHF
jgi:hypothetical protein